LPFLWLQSFLVVAQGFNMVENNMEFRVYATHRESWHFYKAVSAARIEFFAAIKRLREELGITFLKATQPVNLITQPAETGNRSGNMTSGSSTPARKYSGDFAADAPFSTTTGAEGVVNRFSTGVHPVRARSDATTGTSPRGILLDPKKSK
jgi:hypothetical protein